MGAGASTEAAPYASEKEALAAGKTQAEIDAWKKSQTAPAAAAAASAAVVEAQSEAAAARAVATSDASKDEKAGSAALDKQLAVKYGVLHLKGALTEQEP